MTEQMLNLYPGELSQLAELIDPELESNTISAPPTGSQPPQQPPPAQQSKPPMSLSGFFDLVNFLSNAGQHVPDLGPLARSMLNAEIDSANLDPSRPQGRALYHSDLPQGPVKITLTEDNSRNQNFNAVWIQSRRDVDVNIILNPGLGRLLGWAGKKHLEVKGIWLSSNQIGWVDLNFARPQIMFIETNFTDYVTVGERRDQFAAMIPIPAYSKFSADYIIYQPDTPNFIDVLVPNLAITHIQIRDILHNIIDFSANEKSQFEFIFRQIN